MKNRIILFIVVLFSVSSSKAQNFNYLAQFNNKGVPKNLVDQDVIDQDFIDKISAAFPEGNPVPIYNPQYIDTVIETEIILEESAEVWITFVSEGAGYKNAIGYYSYNIDTPLSDRPQDEDINIIFPNYSAKGSGGGLQTGDKVYLGEFEANTAIGWVLIANGWNGNGVGDGLWKLFSNPAFNAVEDQDKAYHNVILNDKDEELFVIGFEDIKRDNNGDEDFNDAIFYITASPYSAIKQSDYNPISGSSAPVELTQFNVELQEEEVLISWITASERNNKGFEIQRSADGISWQKIGFEAGRGFSMNYQHYAFFDQNPLKGINYYRLRQIDFDETTSFSYVRSAKVMKASKASLTVYPNPFIEEISSDVPGRFNIFDISGRTILNGELFNAGERINLSALSKGTYYIELIDNNNNRLLQQIQKL